MSDAPSRSGSRWEPERVGGVPPAVVDRQETDVLPARAAVADDEGTGSGVAGSGVAGSGVVDEGVVDDPEVVPVRRRRRGAVTTAAVAVVALLVGGGGGYAIGHATAGAAVGDRGVRGDGGFRHGPGGAGDDGADGDTGGGGTGRPFTAGTTP